MSNSSFFLKINQIDHTCIFQLSWGQGRSLQAKLTYPSTLSHLYTSWHQLYSQFYGNLRGRVEVSGVGNLPPTDWRVQLAQAEVLLLNEFYFWLSDAALLPIRSTIAQATQASGDTSVDVFITCDAIELERLPWESWEIGKEFAATQAIQVTRSPVNIRHPGAVVERRGRTRILAILGDETGLNFQTEIEALGTLDRQRVADVRFVGWQNQTVNRDVKGAICEALADPIGWDILFFAGHSNETTLSHGEIHVAPGQSMLLKELIPHLKLAQDRGLQVAIFNSCSGLSIAQGLIDLGLRQVVIMREPIHNQVAQEFFLQFVKSLAGYEDIHTAIRSACQYLRLEKSLTFPSAYLVPSLYRHPDAPLFRARAINLRAKLRRWQPTRLEAIGLAGLIFFTGSLRTQQQLVNHRQWVQAIYRDVTGQIEKVSDPPVLLVEIDNQSIDQDDIKPVKPMDKGYLGRLLNQSRSLKAPLVGLDYLLDRVQPEADGIFSQKAQQLVQQGSFLALAASRGADGKWQKPSEDLIDEQSALRVDMDLRRFSGMPSFYAPLRFSGQEILPLSYALAVRRDRSAVSRQATPSLLTALSYRFGQMWLHPIIDYSMPPEQVYQRMSAWQFLRSQPNAEVFKNLQQQVLLITPGLYDDAGVTRDGEDHYVMPEALLYRSQRAGKMPGGEVHAYLMHHWLRRSMVVPIPDLWMILLAAVGAKALLIYGPRWNSRRFVCVGLAVVMLGGGWLSLQVYVGLQVLVPWVSPGVTIGFYLLTPFLRRQWYAGKN